MPFQRPPRMNNITGFLDHLLKSAGATVTGANQTHRGSGIGGALNSDFGRGALSGGARVRAGPMRESSRQQQPAASTKQSAPSGLVHSRKVIGGSAAARWRITTSTCSGGPSSPCGPCVTART